MRRRDDTEREQGRFYSKLYLVAYIVNGLMGMNVTDSLGGLQGTSDDIIVSAVINPFAMKYRTITLSGGNAMCGFVKRLLSDYSLLGF